MAASDAASWACTRQATDRRAGSETGAPIVRRVGRMGIDTETVENGPYLCVCACWEGTKYTVLIPNSVRCLPCVSLRCSATFENHVTAVYEIEG